MNSLKSLEDMFAGLFNGLPSLPENVKEILVKVWPWLALIGGILQFIAAIALWQLVSWTSDLFNAFSAAYYAGYNVGLTSVEKTIIYVGIMMLVVDAVILLMAFPKLQKRMRSGWNLLFLGALINLVYGFTQIFMYGQGMGGFIGSLIGSAIAFYLLFQVREKYNS